MRWVEVAAQRPQRCAVIPFIGAHQAKGFIDTGNELAGWDPHVYVSVVAVEEMARMVGWVPPGNVSGYATEAERLRGRVAELEAEVAEKVAQLAAIGTLKLAGATSARPVGRPKKAVA